MPDTSRGSFFASSAESDSDFIWQRLREKNPTMGFGVDASSSTRTNVREIPRSARQHAERGISRTFVLVDEDASTPKPIVGFFSLNLCQIKSESLSADEAKKLPRDVSGIRLGRLAVAKAYQRRGIGKNLLIAAMGKLIEIFNT